MLKLEIHPDEFGGMLCFLAGQYQRQYDLKLMQQAVADVVLTDYYVRQLTDARIAQWEKRPNKKTYRFTLPLPVARALHQEMRHHYLDQWSQSFFNALDHAVVNYLP